MTFKEMIICAMESELLKDTVVQSILQKILDILSGSGPKALPPPGLHLCENETGHENAIMTVSIDYHK